MQKIHAYSYTALCLPAKGSRISPVLNKVTLMGISNDECKKIYGRKKIIDSIICVKSGGSNEGAGTCQVYSGLRECIVLAYHATQQSIHSVCFIRDSL